MKLSHRILPWLLFCSLAVWVFWGAERVFGSLETHFPAVAKLHQEIEGTIAQGSGISKLSYIVLYFTGYLFWTLLPLWLLSLAFLWLSSTRKNFLARTFEAIGKVIGNVASLAVSWLLILGAAVLLAYFGGFLNLLGTLALIAWLLVTALRGLYRWWFREAE